MDVLNGISTSRLDAVKQLLDSYVTAQRIPGYSCLISRNSEECGYFEGGLMDIERNKPIHRNNLFRIYSMTKPLTSIAIMQLFEQGRFQLDDPVEQFIPELKQLEVYQSGNADNYTTTPAARPMTVRHLLTHTSGLTYGFQNAHVVDELYRRSDIDNLYNGDSMADKIRQVAAIPLQFHPGERWNYGVSTDALGHLVEVLSGKTLEGYISDHITGPLGMNDSGFFVNANNIDRLAACYVLDPQNGQMILEDNPAGSRYTSRPKIQSGGGGMVSTIDDYQRFCQALLNQGELNGNRIIGRKTLDFMHQNHLPENRDLNQMGQSLFSETTFEGVGFGLGFSVLLDPVISGTPGSIGEYGWGGAASTWFMLDPLEQLSIVLMTQLIPSNAYPIRRQLKTAVYQALVG